MPNYEQLRHMMVETQLRPSNVADPALLEAFMAIPREVFIADPEKKQMAYIDEHVHIGDNRYMLSPLLVARMLQAAEIRTGDAVLIIGGAGYMAALAGYLGATVFVLETNREFTENTSRILTEIQEDTVIFVEGDMTKGWPKEAPYSVILFAGGITYLNEDLAEQMDNGGKIIAPVIQSDGKNGMLQLWEKWHHHIATRGLFDTVAPMLPDFTESKDFVF